MKTEPAPEATLPRARVMLEYRPLEAGFRSIQESIDSEKMADFCSLLRMSKLLYFHNDRQEPGAFDRVARDVASLGLQVLDSAAHIRLTREAELAAETIRYHISEIEERLQTLAGDRTLLDEKRRSADLPVAESAA